MHAMDMLHRDLKPDNMFMHEPVQGGPCIGLVGDVGLCAIADRRPCDQPATELWRAPETPCVAPKQVQSFIVLLGWPPTDALCLYCLQAGGTTRAFKYSTATDVYSFALSVAISLMRMV